ncbi:hypothetical protein GJ496_002618 [Pomphorhynchus laevis]|nr:hypothetical protein GJ496_009194 [Pomphorhynchus laevis]KAI0986972.1 hypothetical protein GJ496_002618 [Pomphorhynchus laevis]
MENIDREPAVEIVLRKFFVQRSRLRTITKISALLSGFATAALVEFQVVPPHSKSIALDLYIVVTCTLIGVHFIALMISNSILPSVDFISTEEQSAERIEFLTDKAFTGTQPYMKLAWILSTFVGTFLFLVDVALIGWMQFINIQKTTSIAAVVTVSIVIVIFIFIALRLQSKMSDVRLNIRNLELERMKDITLT